MKQFQLVLSVGAVAFAFFASSLTFAQSPCEADIDGSGIVDGADLAKVLTSWGSCPPSTCEGDIDGDGMANGTDLAMVLTQWGECPPPAPGWATVLEWAPNATVVTDAAVRQRMVATGLPWRVKDTATQIQLVLVPPGDFAMGCSASQLYPCTSNENPIHQVTITQPYYLGRFEVTQGQWQARMGSNPAYHASYADSPTRPVEQVSWNTIQGFLTATGMRLPTEAEWEYAYRAGTTTAFHSMPGHPNGTNDDSQLVQIAWYNANALGQTHSVGQKAGNGFGLHDMSGNVWEWVSDRHGAYSSAPAIDPQGSATSATRGFRGGAWFYDSSDGCRSSRRVHNYPSYSSNLLGFRVVRTP